MIVAAVVFALSMLTAAVTWKASAGVFEGYVFQRHNYRDQPLPTAVGVIIPLVVAAVVALYEVLFDPWRSFTTGSYVDLNFLKDKGGAMVAVCVAFSFLGLIDDLGGVGESGGFRGHIRALFAGRLTTGMVKFAGGGFIAVALVGGLDVSDGRVAVIRDAAIVCLAANLGNLFDRAPGRAIKAGFAAFAILAAFTWDGRLVLAAMPVGAAAGLLRADLREEMMIGDAGANALGAGLGLAAVVGTGSAARWWLLAVLLMMNLASEVVSFSKVIDAVAPLRWIDRLGSRRGAN